MNRQLITPEPKIVSIDSQPMNSNSSYGTWVIEYSIKWHKEDKNKIGTMIFFFSKQKANEWIVEQQKNINNCKGVNNI